MKRLYMVGLVLFAVSCTPDNEGDLVTSDDDASTVDSGGWRDAPEGSRDADLTDAPTTDTATTDTGGPTADARASSEDSGTDATTGDAATDVAPDVAMPDVVPGGKANYSVVIADFDTTGTTWARHANYTFDPSGTVASTHWHWESSLEKGKTPYTWHRCTFDGVTKDCYTYTPTGWVFPAGQYVNGAGTFELTDSDSTVEITWDDGRKESWSIETTSTSGLMRLAFASSTYGITHGKGYGSNAAWTTFRTLQEIVTAGGLKRWDGQMALAASADGSTITTRDWRPTGVDLSNFHSSSNTSVGFTLHAMLPHSANVCTGGCTGSRTGFIMYHLASNNMGRQMVYNNWCTCLSLGDEWPCYNRNMHPLAFNSIIDDTGTHRGWLFVEQQNQPGYTGYQYQIGDFTDL